MHDKNLAEALYKASKKNVGVTIVKSQKEEQYLPYSNIYKRATNICTELKKRNLSPNTEILIKCKNTEYFIYAFWACAIGGYIAIPMETKKGIYKEQQDKEIIEMLESAFLLYDLEEEIYLDEFEENQTLNLSKFDFTQNQTEDVITSYETISKDRTAYIQFSSGSTGKPKGVPLSERNIITNIESMIINDDMGENESSLTWQPLTHCYGLIRYHVLPVVYGIHQYIIPTGVFMKHPILWMEKTNEHRATRLGSVPFALKHFLSMYQLSQNEYHWDLSCVREITIGGEQVNKQVLLRFCEAMSVYRLNRMTVIPAYGLAEGTTMVSSNTIAEAVRYYKFDECKVDIGQAVQFQIDDRMEESAYVSMGKILPRVQVKICDDAYKELPEKRYGHILIKGDSVIHHYYRNEQADKELFYHDWLDTGDIGFMEDGNLVVVGRDKELIISMGKKYSCIALEEYIRQKVAKFGIAQIVAVNVMDLKNHGEKLCVFVETPLNLKKMLDKKTFAMIADTIQDEVFHVSDLMVDEVIPVQSLPKTFSGKIRRKELSNLYVKGAFDMIREEIKEGQETSTILSEKVSKENFTRNKLIQMVVEKINQMFGIRINDYNLAFKEYGVVSVNIPTLVKELEDELQISIGVSTIFNYPNINKFVDYLLTLLQDEKLIEEEKLEENEEGKVAIIGVSCRLPGGADNIQKYWNTLFEGIDGIVDIPESRWDLDKYYSEDETIPGKMYCKKGGFLDIPIDEFDARLFNISPKEASSMDPQQKLLLELTWEAFENANLNIRKYSGTNTGVYLGISANEYALANLYSGDLSSIDAYSLTGNVASVACGRVSYSFGFEGPCFAVDTACSSGLTALHLACNAVKAEEAQLAVVAGVNLMLSPTVGVAFSKLHATCTDGHSKAFDASANGYGRGEGGGVLLLKKYKKAVKDHDNILGVICASGINQDGTSNGLTAPNGASQANLIRKTLKKANLNPEDIEYMETHGTGTNLGDPIEFQAIADTYGKGHTKESPFYIGSVKSNIGHLEPASGMASMIKVLLSFQHDLIPANLHFHQPNPLIDWEKNAICVVDHHLEWRHKDRPRRAAISGFGFGGSNAHIIVEDCDKKAKTYEEAKKGINYILKLSAKSKKSLREYIAAYASFLEQSEDKEFADILYTADRTRVDLEYRFSVSASSKQEMQKKLRDYLQGLEPEGVYTNLDSKDVANNNQKIVFMFTGQGSQYVYMGRMLYDTCPAFHDAMDSCDKLFRPYLLRSIIELIYSENASNEAIQNTEYAQPLIFAVEYALYQMWSSLGVTPNIVMGHSIGEYTAATAAGIMSLEDAVKLVAIRGRLMSMAPGDGGMGTVFADIDTVEEAIRPYGGKVSVAAHNAEKTCSISGEKKLVYEALEQFTNTGIKTKRLKVSHGFHSELMTPILDDFKKIADEVKFMKAKLPFASALYARVLEEDEILDAEYWTKHLRGMVDFYGTVKKLASEGEYIYLEVGPNQVLSALCKLIFGDSQKVEGTLSIKKEEAKQLAGVISSLYAAGVDIEWTNLNFCDIHTWNKVQLPMYPYDKQIYWKGLEFDRSVAKTTGLVDNDPKLLGQRIESILMKDVVIFQRKFRADEPYFMKEHVIFGRAISPAAAHLSMLISAVKEVKNPKSCTLQSVELRVPLAIGENEERIVQVCLEDIQDNKMKFQLVSRDAENDSNWVIHAVGNVLVSNEYEEEPDASIEEFKAMPEDEITPENGVYALMQGSGFYLGTGFRRIMKSSCFKNGSVCQIQPKKDIVNYDMYDIYPGVLDSILQTQLCTLLEQLNTRNDGKKEDERETLIPYYIGSFTFYYTSFDELWVCGESSLRQDVVYSHLNTYNADGKLVIKISNIMANMTNRNILLRDIKDNYTNLYYNENWTKQTNTSEGKSKWSGYAILTDDNKTAERLMEGLCKQGIAKETIFTTVMKDRENVKKQDEMAAFVQSCRKNNCEKLIYAVGFEYTDLIDCSLAKENAVCLMYLIQEIIVQDQKKQMKLKVVTKDVLEDGRNLNQSTLWGFMKVVSLEYPNLYDGIVDTDDITSEEFQKELLLDDTDEVRIKKNERYISKLLKYAQYKKNHPEKNQPIEIKEDASYLITGGTGALGLKYLEILVQKGARHVLLMARNMPKESVQLKLNEYKKAGIDVRILYADVCQLEEVEQAIYMVRNEVPNIKGIIHAAGCIEDHMIADQTCETFEKVINPKVIGTMNLYQVMKQEALDFVIFMSSITSVLGNIGQSNYAAANSFMNVMAKRMQKEGIPAYAICWGPWQTGGMAAGKEEIDKNLSNMGIHAFTPDMGGEIMSNFFEQPLNPVMILDVNWSKFVSNTYGNWQIHFLDAFIEKENNQEPEEDKQSITDQLIKMNKDERKLYLLTVLREKCSKIMGFEDADLLSTETGLREQGADSLMIFSMRAAINKLLHIDMDVSTFFNYPTLSKLTDYIMNSILPKEEEETETMELDETLEKLNSLIYNS